MPDLVELGLKKSGNTDRTVAIGLTILVDRLLVTLIKLKGQREK